MSWIKDNTFIVALAGGTLVGAAALLFVGFNGSSKYEAAKAGFDESLGEASRYEALKLYPTDENRDAKRKALIDYRGETETLQAAFDKYRHPEKANIPPQEFTDRLKASQGEVAKAFADAGTALPPSFFLGFESYTTSLANGNATGILAYQLDAVKAIMLDLAKAAPSQLYNIHRPALPEENGQAYQPSEADIARALPLEISFRGPEASVRKFVSSISKQENHYVVIRSLRISNVSKAAPKSSDGKFETPAAAAPAADEGFTEFVLPGEESADAGEEETPAPEAAPAPAVTDAGQILAQVLGKEEVNAFFRLDILDFLPAKELAQP